MPNDDALRLLDYHRSLLHARIHRRIADRRLTLNILRGTSMASPNVRWAALERGSGGKDRTRKARNGTHRWTSTRLQRAVAARFRPVLQLTKAAFVALEAVNGVGARRRIDGQEQRMAFGASRVLHTNQIACVACSLQPQCVQGCKSTIY